MSHPAAQRRGWGARAARACAHGRPVLEYHDLPGVRLRAQQPSVALFRRAGFADWGLLPRWRNWTASSATLRSSGAPSMAGARHDDAPQVDHRRAFARTTSAVLRDMIHALADYEKLHASVRLHVRTDCAPPSSAGSRRRRSADCARRCATGRVRAIFSHFLHFPRPPGSVARGSFRAARGSRPRRGPGASASRRFHRRRARMRPVRVGGARLERPGHPVLRSARCDRDAGLAHRPRDGRFPRPAGRDPARPLTPDFRAIAGAPPLRGIMRPASGAMPSCAPSSRTHAPPAHALRRPASPARHPLRLLVGALRGGDLRSPRGPQERPAAALHGHGPRCHGDGLCRRRHRLCGDLGPFAAGARARARGGAGMGAGDGTAAACSTRAHCRAPRRSARTASRASTPRPRAVGSGSTCWPRNHGTLPSTRASSTGRRVPRCASPPTG